MGDVMMSLGDFQFGVSTAEYQGLKTSMSWRWAKKDRYQRKPAKQFHGPDSDSKTFEISIYPQGKKDLAIFQRIKALADAGKPLRLVAGGSRMVQGELIPSGADLGLWVIERLDVDENMFMRDGVALEFKGSLSISEYGDDEV